MSLIVEALKKAQRERDAIITRPAIEIRQAMPSRRTPWLPLSVAIIIAGLAVGGAFLIGSSTAQHPDTVLVATKNTYEPAPVTVAPVLPSRPEPVLPAEPVPAEPAQTVAPPPVESTAPEPHADGEDLRLQAMLARPAVPAQPTAPVAAPRPPKVTDTRPDSAQVPRNSRIIARYEPPSASTNRRAPEPSLPADDEYASAPIIQNLPADIKAKLPELKLNIHVYSADPAKRFVFINSRRYREGATLSDDITLEKITPTGVLLRTHETLFRLVIES